MRLGDRTSPRTPCPRFVASYSYFVVMFIPTVTHPKPLTFFNITPINPTGLTIVDLGRMDEDSAPNLDDSAVAQATVARQNSEAARHTSLPPETRLQRHEHIRGGRHNSLPPKTVTIRHASPIPSANVSETDSDNDSVDSVEEASSMAKDSPTNVSYP